MIQIDDSVKFILINIVISVILISILMFSAIFIVCSNSWQKIGLIYQGVGVILLTFMAFVGGEWGLQSLNVTFSKNISRFLKRYTPVLGVSFASAGTLLVYLSF